MSRGCLDWQKRERMSLTALLDYRIDIHHIFPKAWCDDNGVDQQRRDSIVNKTAISSATNRSIGRRTPGDYLPILERKAKIPPAELDEILTTHAIDAHALRENDFDSFFEDRKHRLLKMISDAMGKPAIIDPTP